MQKIMFNDKYGLTKAVLEGGKTQTRRVIEKRLMYKIQSFQEDYFNATLDCLKGKELIEAYFLNYPNSLPYKLGEVVAVAQNYKDAHIDFIQCDLRPKHNHIWGHTCNMRGWNNKMFVQPKLMPHQICITKVRIERLQDISDEDCMKEGIERLPYGGSYKPYAFYDYSIRIKSEKEGIHYGSYRDFNTPREAYAKLIDKVSGKGTWESNPYVFVYDFELVR